MSVEHQSFDLEKVYDEEITPLMTKIIDICKAHKLPMFASFLYSLDVDSEQDGTCTTNLMFEDRPIPPEMLSLVEVVGLVRQKPLRLRVRNKEGVITEETVIYP